MPGQSQEAFLGRIRQALTDRGKPVDLPGDLEIARVFSREQDVMQVFVDRVKEGGMQSYRVADEPALVDQVVEIMRSAGAASALVPQDDLPARESIVERLKQEGIKLYDPEDRDAGFKADFGITGVRVAVAETASLCVFSGGNHRRLASLAVPNYIAIVRADQIVPDLVDWAAQLPTADMPANAVLISGPSKTADIEMIIITGVHGPGHVHVVIVG